MLSAPLIAILALGFASTSAFAASPATATIAVTATVSNTCTVANGTLTFGAYTGAKLPVTGTFSATCTSGADFIIALDKGIGSGATLANRLMTNASNSAITLPYSIVTQNGGTVVWGDGTNGTSTVTNVGTGTAQTVSVFGVIAAGQPVLSGNYSDTITATVTY